MLAASKFAAVPYKDPDKVKERAHQRYLDLVTCSICVMCKKPKERDGKVAHAECKHIAYEKWKMRRDFNPKMSPR